MKYILPFALLLPLCAHAELLKISPTSYTFDTATSVGSFDYRDETGRQLIDGSLGAVPWYSDLGHGPAYEWVGWTSNLINIDFDFEKSRTVKTIVVSSQQGSGGLVLPSWSVYGWQNGNWVQLANQDVLESQSEFYKKYDLTLSDLNFSSGKFRVQLRQETAGFYNWTFVDEISFYQTQEMFNLDQNQASVVPTPGLFAILLFGFLSLTTRLYKRRT